jgi:hypothetical protein
MAIAPRHPGEGRDLFVRWAPAFAGVTKWMTPLRIRKIDEKRRAQSHLRATIESADVTIAGGQVVIHADNPDWVTAPN